MGVRIGRHVAVTIHARGVKRVEFGKYDYDNNSTKIPFNGRSCGGGLNLVNPIRMRSGKFGP